MSTGKWMLFATIAVICGFSAPNLSAVDSAAQDECVRELLMSYFPEPIVKDTLKKYNVAEDKWAGIAKTLSEKDKDIVKMVQEKAATMDPNPLKDPKERQAAVKLFRDTLMSVFTKAMEENGVTDSTQFQGMLDDIQQQKAKKFAMCLEKHKTESKAAQSSAKSDEDEDDDDDDDSDYDDEEEEHSDQKKDVKPAVKS